MQSNHISFQISAKLHIQSASLLSKNKIKNIWKLKKQNPIMHFPKHLSHKEMKNNALALDEDY